MRLGSSEAHSRFQLTEQQLLNHMATTHHLPFLLALLYYPVTRNHVVTQFIAVYTWGIQEDLFRETPAVLPCGGITVPKTLLPFMENACARAIISSRNNKFL